jgi:hypothetical protein
MTRTIQIKHRIDCGPVYCEECEELVPVGSTEGGFYECAFWGITRLDQTKKGGPKRCNACLDAEVRP